MSIGSLRAAAGAALAGLALATCGQDEPPPPNLVIIALDTLRPDHLGCYGYERGVSANLDRFASSAVVFERAESPAPWTAPALLSLMTSLHPSVHGVRGFPEPQRMNARVVTLAEILRAQGYDTAAFTDGGYAKGQFGLDQGFRVYPTNEDDSLDEHGSNLKHPSRVASNVDRTLQWLERRAREPFFLFFHTYEVHGPYRAPEAIVKRLRPSWDEAGEHARLAAVIERWNSAREIEVEGAQLVLNHYQHCKAAFVDGITDLRALQTKLRELGIVDPERPFDPGTLDFVRDHYDAEIEYMDGELARLLAFLDRPELAANTVVVVVSDHGEGIGEHRKIGHGEVLHAEVLRIVMVVRAPGVAPGRVTEPVTALDVMPTVLELLGCEAEPSRMQGRSLVAALNGVTPPSAPTYSHALSHQGEEDRLFSIRDGDWRLIWDESQHAATLFDLANDPGETRDVSAEHAEIAATMLGRLRAQRDLDQWLAQAVAGPVEPYSSDPDTISDLEQLGYVEVGTKTGAPKKDDADKKPR